MLRAHSRTWQDRGHPFVCALCRRKRSISNEHQTNQLSSLASAFSIKKLPRPSSTEWLSRSFSTTAHNRNDSSNGPQTGPRPPGLGTFPNAFAGNGGTWGSFANSGTRAQNGPSLGDQLLPHEREARLRSNLVPPTVASTAASTAAPTPQGRAAIQSTGLNEKQQRYRMAQDMRANRRPNEAQANLSRSVLADVFKTKREPRAPSTPQSWFAGNQGSRGSTTTPSSLKSLKPLQGSFSGTRGSDQNGQSSNNFKGTGWRLPISNPKSETSQRHPESHRQRRNEFSAGHETIRSRPGAKARPHHRLKSHNFNQTTAANEGSEAAAVAPRQDFWGELENRTTSLRDRQQQRNGASKDGTVEATKAIDSATMEDDFRSVAEPANKGQDRRSGLDGQSSKQRRKSRFDLDEQAEMESRNSKNSKSKNNQQKSRRLSEDHDWDDEAVHRWEQKQRRKAEKEAQKQRALEEEPAVVPIFLPEYISASNLSKALKQQVDQFLRDMEEMGFENVTPDTIFTGETAALIAMEYGFEPTVDSGSQRDLRPRPVPADVSLLPSRPPVVTIMGHVDHGKTTLLDWLRKSSIVSQEHGGITQHIGAFIVKMSSGKSITFLDTPGHAAFLSMRQRGANVTDIVVLVVAADDSVKPQTLEALKHATNAKVPIIVAINKVDKEDADIDQVKADLSRHGVEIEDFGGDVQVVCVSGKTGRGMEDLEENIVTLSEVLDVRAENDGMAEGWILESSIKSQGKAATILVKRGTLRPGDFIVAGQTWARIRTLRNEAGQEIDAAPPGTPVEIMGWRELPSAGEQVLQAPDEKKAKTAVEYRLEMAEREQSSIQLAEQEQRQREKAAAEAAAAAAAEEQQEASRASTSSAEPGVILQNFTVKADVVGSVEAVCGTIQELGSNEVQPKVLRSSAGPITEYDVDHAAASNSVIINFNCPIQPHIKQRAAEAKVKILDHNVIYHVVDDVKATLSALLPMAVSYRVTGEADVVQVFSINLKRRKYQNIAGCRVRNGSIKKSSRVKVLRRGEVIFDGSIDTLKHVKKDVQEMGKNTECGIGLDGFEDLQADDQIQTYEEIKEKRHL